MKIEDLMAFTLDLNLGGGWPQGLEPRPSWPVGRKWRVEYTFSSPAVSVAGLALGSEVRGIWRYEVVGEEKDEKSGEERVILRVSPERKGEAGYHFLAAYRKKDLSLASARRFEGEEERPFEMSRLPPFDETLVKSEDGRSFKRTFEMKPPPGPPSAVEDAAFGGGEAAI